MLLLLIAAQTGQLDKFETKAPIAEYETAAKMEDVERCLLKRGSLPNVYRQPDRPDHVTLVWLTAPGEYGVAAGRIDLRRAGSGTSVKSWMKGPRLADCAPVDSSPK